VTGQAAAELAGDLLALGIALIGWALHVRECRATVQGLRDENRRLIEALARGVENGAWRRAP
jgi:hypothetical protein